MSILDNILKKEDTANVNPWKYFLRILRENRGMLYGELVGLSMGIPVDNVPKRELSVYFSSIIIPDNFVKKLKLDIKKIPMPPEFDIEGGWIIPIVSYASNYFGVKLNIICYFRNPYEPKGLYETFMCWPRKKVIISGEKVSLYLYPWTFGSKQSFDQLTNHPFTIPRFEFQIDQDKLISIWNQITK